MSCFSSFGSFAGTPMALALPPPVAVTVAVILWPRIMMVSRISVSLVMKAPKGTMIGTVLATAVKAIFVGAFVGVRQLVVEPIVSAVAVVFVIVGKCGHHGYAQHQHACHLSSCSWSHDLSPSS